MSGWAGRLWWRRGVRQIVGSVVGSVLLALGAGCGEDGGSVSTDTASDVATDTASEGDVRAEDGHASDVDATPREAAVVPLVTGIRAIWDAFPHRFSQYEIAFEPDGDGDGADGGTLTLQNDGGPWGAVDATTVEVDLEVWETRQLAVAYASVELEIPPGAEDDGVPYRVRGVATVDAGELAGADDRVAFIRGWRISTVDYTEPPAFQTDSELPYDPIDGFTTQGLGIALGAPVEADGRVEVAVTARNTLGLSDRADMNAAIPQATTWMRVDVVVVGVFGEGAAVTRAGTDYTLGSEEYGSATVYEPASLEEQRVELSGPGGAGRAVFGVTAFDFWVNVDGRHDPECVVIQDEINTWGEAVSGPGRYVREMVVRVGETEYDPASGAGAAHLELMLHNSSVAKEVGNICLGASGEVAMVQFDDAEATRPVKRRETVRVESGDAIEHSVTW